MAPTRSRSPIALILTLLLVPLSHLMAVEEVAAVDFSVDHGVYTSAFDVTLSCATAGATIRYTTDGSPPSASTGSTVSGAITIPGTTPLRAIALKDGMRASPVATRTYLFPQDVLNQPADIPGYPHQSGIVYRYTPNYSVSITNEVDASLGLEASDLTAIGSLCLTMSAEDWNKVNDGDLRVCSAEYINPNNPSLNWQIDCGIKPHSHSVAKRSFRLKFSKDYDDRGNLNSNWLRAAPGGATATDTFDSVVLRAGLNRSAIVQYNPHDTTYTRDQFARNNQIAMSGYGGHGTFAHLYINGIYRGLYNPSERYDIRYQEQYFGGKEADYLTISHSGEHPDEQPASSEDDWNYFNEVLDTRDLTDPAVYAEALEYVDIDNMADYWILNMFSGIGDWPGNNWWMGHQIRPLKGFRFFIWDAEDTWDEYGSSGPDNRSGGRGNDGPTWRVFHTSNKYNSSHIMNTMWANSDFRMHVADRAYRHLFNNGALTVDNLLTRWRALNGYISDAVDGEFARYGHFWEDYPNDPRAITKDNMWLPDTERVEGMLLGTPGASEHSDNGDAVVRMIGEMRNDGDYPMIDPPLFSSGGTAIETFTFPITGATTIDLARDGTTGTIYYTTDGSDPRASGGAIAGIDGGTGTSISMEHTGWLKARTWDGSEWSALHALHVLRAGDYDDLRISEIMYHAPERDSGQSLAISEVVADANGRGNGAFLTDPIPWRYDNGDNFVVSGAGTTDNNGTFNAWSIDRDNARILINGALADESISGQLQWWWDGDRYEFVELRNLGSRTLDLSGVGFADGIRFTFPEGTTLAPGANIVIASSLVDFAGKYPSVATTHQFAGSLDNGGERLTLVDQSGAVITSVAYDDANGYPLAADGTGRSLIATDLSSGNDQDRADAWDASNQLGGNPGGDDAPAGNGGVLVNEALTHTDLPQVDSVELYNPSGSAIDIGGWYLTDDKQLPTQWRIPNGTEVPKRGYLVIDENDFGATFRLSSLGDGIYLFATDSGGSLSGYSHGFSFPPAFNGVSFGRHVIPSTGEEQFVAQTSVTLGSENSGPRVGPVVISEVQYHPADGEVDYVELHNNSGAAVALYDAANGNPWRLAGTGFSFAPGDEIPAGGLALVVKDDPASFRSRHSVPASVPIFGPFPAKLDNGGETIELLQPDGPTVDGDGLTVVPEVPVEILTYDDEAPWPTDTDGAGPSLHRLDLGAHGNDVANWESAAPSPGDLSIEPPTNAPPVVQAGPDQTVIIIDSANLAGTVSDDGLPSGSLSIAWSKQSGPGTVSFVDANAATTTATFSDAGTYVLKLVGNDGELNSSDTVEVIVDDTNDAPTADAGADDSVRWPNSHTLAGMVDDDGLPSRSLSSSWQQISGPGTADFTDAASPTSQVSFDDTGTYVLELTADDGELTASDRVTITVEPPPALRVQVFGTERQLSSVLGYSDQDLTPQGWSVSDDGRTIHLTGNTWKRLPLAIDITADTVLRVTVDTANVGEIQAIGVDDDNDHDNATTTFQFDGTDAWDQSDRRFWEEGGGERVLDLPIGELFTGPITALVLINDDDGDANAEASFTDLAFYDSTSSRTIHLRVMKDGTVRTSRMEADQSGSVVYEQETDEHTVEDLIREVETRLRVFSFSILAADG